MKPGSHGHFMQLFYLHKTSLPQSLLKSAERAWSFLDYIDYLVIKASV